MGFSTGADARNGGRHGDYRRLSPDLLPPRFVAYHEGLTKSSGSIRNVMRFRAEIEHDPAAAEAMAYKAAVVNEALAALRQGQRDRLGPIMDRDFDLRQSVCGPAPEQTRMIAIAREQGAHAKFTGSGSAAIQGCGGADARRACSRRGTFGLRGAVEVGFVAGGSLDRGVGGGHPHRYHGKPFGRVGALHPAQMRRVLI